MAIWRAMTSSDLAGVLLVADEVHPELREDPHIFAERLSLFPEGCYALFDGETVVGYAITHPIKRGQPPKLNRPLGSLPKGACDFYIHDVALLPSQRGGGYARQIIERLLRLGRSYDAIGLISVYETAAFWGRFGFEPNALVSRETLAHYGEGAVFMSYRSALSRSYAA